jgi:aspartyl-tRNA(Asn)/glutamyl-tRNA(Gln) amidotransferase subunit A
MSKAFTAKEVVQAYVNKMDSTRYLNCFITETADLALRQAIEADERIQNNEARPLEGLPLAIKDNFCTKGILTSAASKILSNFVPPYESTITQKLKDAGVISLGKTNLDDCAMGSSTITSYYDPSINPWKKEGSDRDLTPGGSSGGSAASVAARSSLIALGTDTGGSIRQPASFCGIVGLKPTYGLCSRYGIVAFASSLDQAGPLTRTVQDSAIVLKHMVGHDPKDFTSVKYPVPDYEAALTGNIKGLKVGIPKEYRMEGLDSEISEWWEKTASWLSNEGAEIVDVSLPHTRYALPVYYIIAPAEASSNLARYDGIRYGYRAPEAENLEEIYEMSRTQGFGDEVKRRILIGTYVLSSGKYEDYYLRAQKVRQKVADDFTNVFKKVDVLLTPTTAGTAFELGENVADPLAMYLQDLFTVATNLAGIPAISVPVSKSKEGLPIGMQLMGPRFGEEVLLKTADVIEKLADFKLKEEF